MTEIAEIMLQTILAYRDAGAYLLHEFVIMPNHVHLLLTPGPETSLEKAAQLIKGGSSHRIHKARRQKMDIWQVGFHDWTVRDAEDWRAKVEYIHMNPVRARLVDRAEDWVYSSASGRYRMDPVPQRYLSVTSGAKAQDSPRVTQGLKPLPPKEEEAAVPPVPQGLKPIVSQSSNVGAKAPTPGALTAASEAKAQVPVNPTQGLKPLPPEEKEYIRNRSREQSR